MAGNLTNYPKNELRTHLFRTGSYTKPATLYMGLFTAAPSDAGGGTEVSGTGYARLLVGPGNADWSADATPGRTLNINTLQYGAPTSDWGVVAWAGLFDGAGGGANLLMWVAIDANTVNSGDAAPAFDASAIDFQWD